MKLTRRNLLLTTAVVAAQVQSRSEVQDPAAQPVARIPGRRFEGDALREIAFPLGGIGTGTVSLAGYGNLRDWEIFNRPNKGGVLPFTFAALRLEGGGLKTPLIRVLEGRPHPPFTGASGVPRETALGLPRFRDAIFTGAYPFAQVAL
ncbi:MAG: GH116 family glycosyl-hydrolase, partial [Bryobacteraceae bacterium]